MFSPATITKHINFTSMAPSKSTKEVKVINKFGTRTVTKIAKVNYVGIEPTTKLIQSTRKSGYNNYGAIADIVDNCLEPRVGASNVYINVNVQKQISIADNGIGMSYESLVEAMRMGARNHATGKGVLGGFGLGMKTAGTSLGKRITVITQEDGENMYVAEYDVDDIDQLGQYLIPLNEATDAQRDEFDFLTYGATHGTVVIISKLDEVKTANTGTFVKTLRRRMGEIFRLFLADKTITINGMKLQPVDIMMDSLGSIVHYNEAHTITFRENGEQKSADIRVKLYILPDLGGKSLRDEEDADYRVNPTNQGLYFMRNNRQIIRAELLDIVSRDPYNNRFRGEVFIDGALDAALGLNYMKNDIASRSEEVQRKLKDIIRPQFQAIRRILDRERGRKHAEDEVRQEENKQIEQEINSHWKELGLLEKTVRKTGETREKEDDEIEKEIQKRNQRTPDSNRPNGDQAGRAVVEIRAMAMGADGNIVEYTDKGNGSLVMTWNTEHIYYDNFVAEADRATYKALVNLFVAQGRHLFKTLLGGDFQNGGKAEFETKLSEYNQNVSREVTMLM